MTTTATAEIKTVNHKDAKLPERTKNLTPKFVATQSTKAETEEKAEVALGEGAPQEKSRDPVNSVVTGGATVVGYIAGALVIRFPQEEGRASSGVISVNLPGLAAGEYEKIKKALDGASSKTDQINEALRIIAIIKGDDQFDRDLSGIRFSNLTLDGVNLGCCRLDNAKWENVTLNNCCLLGSTNDNSKWIDVNMQNCDCSGSHWGGNVLVNGKCHFDGNTFNGAEMGALDLAFANRQRVTFKANKLIGADGLAGGRVLGRMNALLDQLDGFTDKSKKDYKKVRAEILELFKGTVFEPKGDLEGIKNRLANHNLVRAATPDETGVKKSYSDFVEAISQHVHSRDIHITGGKNNVDYIGVILPNKELALFVKEGEGADSYPSFDKEHSTWKPDGIATGKDTPLHEIYKLFLMGERAREEGGAVVIADTANGDAADVTAPGANAAAAPDAASATPATETEDEKNRKAAKKAVGAEKSAKETVKHVDGTKDQGPSETTPNTNEPEKEEKTDRAVQQDPDVEEDRSDDFCVVSDQSAPEQDLNDNKDDEDRSAEPSPQPKQSFRNKVRVVGRFIADILLEPPTS